MMYSSNAEKISSGEIDKKTMQKIAKQMKGKIKF